MLIVADENIPAIREAFSPLAKVRTAHGRHLTAGNIRDADALLVRSITRVDASLLSGSRIRFVGSATSGTDHVDLEWLASHDIQFAHAPACNATSAAEYVISALCAVSKAETLRLADKTVGIIGCGNVGSRVRSIMQAMGIRCLTCDPPLAERQGQAHFVAMQEVARADIITVHVPLVKAGKYATYNLINQAFIEALPADSIFINTSRGDVVDEAALKEKLRRHSSFRAILDVWKHEPMIDVELVKLAALATPHIAGYSVDGKLRATQALYHAVCEFFGKTPQWNPQAVLPQPRQPEVTPSPALNVVETVAQCLRHVYDAAQDDRNLRATLALPKEERARAFDALRKQYAARRECAAYRVVIEAPDIKLDNALAALGFGVVGNLTE